MITFICLTLVTLVLTVAAILLVGSTAIIWIPWLDIMVCGLIIGLITQLTYKRKH